MEPLNDLKNNWNQDDSEMNRTGQSVNLLSGISVLSGANREKNKVIQYFWAAFVYQIILYALFCWTFFRNMGNRAILLAVLTGLCANIPFTWALLKRFKIMYGQSLSRGTPGYSIKTNIELYYTRLSAFFRFKKFADGFLLPVNAFIAAFILFGYIYSRWFFSTSYLGIYFICRHLAGLRDRSLAGEQE